MTLNLILSLYLTVSAFAILHTWREQQASGVSSPMFRAIGYVLCALWPLTTFCFILLIYGRRN